MKTPVHSADKAAGGLSTHKTLVHALKHNATHSADHVLIEWVNSQCEVESSITYQELWYQSGLVAALLLKNDIKRGDRVMIAYPFGLEFLSGLFGCMRIGVIPCSVYPPNVLDKSKARFSFAQFNNQVKDAGAKFALTSTLFKRGLFVAALSGHKTDATKWLATDKLKPSTVAKEVEELQVSPGDTAFIQYSSGSTGAPKGIVISHGAVTHNLAVVRALLKDTGRNRLACWLPQYHDYGLVLKYLTACVNPQYPISACSPIDFIRNPLLWADMIEKFDVTGTAAPNFAYALLVKRMKAVGRNFSPKSRLVQVNIAAEPIAPTTLAALEDIGISRGAINPCYGLAEVCVAATDCIGDEVRIHEGVVSCGRFERSERFGKYIRVASEDGAVLPDDEVGQIYIRGPDLASGYWNKPELTKQFHCKLSDGEEYFATGDLGKVVDGLLYVVGRLKELIIINGKNVYPHDIERVIESEYPDIVRPGSTVAFQNAEDDIGVALEIRQAVRSLDDVSDVFSEAVVRRLVNDACGVKIGDLKCLKQGSTPKTTSGKLKRVETRRRSLEGSWPVDTILSCTTMAKPASPRLESHATTRGEAEAETTIKSVVGQDIDMEADWESNGLTSLMHAELITRVQEVHQVTIPINFQQTCLTPHQLKLLIEVSSYGRFPTKLPNLDQMRKWSNSCRSLPLPLLGLLQAIGTLLMFLTFAGCLIPAYYVGKYTVHLSTTFEIGSSGRYATLAWLPVAVPIFFVTFSVTVVLLKWLVIGQYHSGIVDLPSVSYLRWWFMDRLMDLWERWVGGFIVDTKLIWVFYRLLGARLAWSCDVKDFIRELDLVEVGSNSSIEHQIRCRKFPQWNEGHPCVVFRAVTVGNNCMVKGMLGPGVNLGGSSKVDVFAALPEGSQVAEGTLVKGSPAFNAGSYDGVGRKRGYWLVETLKVVWLLVEVYLFFAMLLLSQICLNQQLPDDWRYTPLLHWMLLLVLTSVFGVFASIVLKWALIGRRRPETGESLCWRRICRWCCDYHFSVVAMTLAPVFGMSRVWNVILWLHGLDVDLISKPGASLGSFPPSKVDLVRIRRSFLSNISIDSGSDYIEIVDSSLGFSVHIGPGVQIVRSVIPPRAMVDDSVFDANFQDDEQRSSHSCMVQIIMESVQVGCALLVCASFIPAYELFVAKVFDAAPGAAILWLGAIVAVQSLAWIMAERMLQTILHLSNDPTHLFMLYSSNLSTAWQNHDWNILVTCLRGTCYIRYWLWFMGSRVEGQLWYFGSDIYDFPKLSFRDKTIIDDAHIAGHHVVFGNVVLDETWVGGVVHPGTYCPAGSKLEGGESGPWKVYLGRSEKMVDVTDDSMRSNIEDSDQSFSA